MSWIFKYCWMGISGSLYAMGTDMATIGGTFGGTAPEAETLGEALGMMFGNGIFGIGNGVWLIVGLVASLAIMAFGVGNGIEKANKVMMPALFFLFVILGIYICTLPGASEGYKYIFTLKPGCKAEYQKRHAEIWPVMVKVLKDAGICNYSIFYCNDELFGYYECEKGVAYEIGRASCRERV